MRNQASYQSAALLSSTFNRTGPEAGIFVVDGYGLRIRVERGGLQIDDGLGQHQRSRRFSKVQRHLHRLVVLGHSGTVSLDALRWMADTGVSFCQIDSDGRVLTSTATPGLDDARLRRIQASAPPDAVLRIVKRLLVTKLRGQAGTVEQRLDDQVTAQRIEEIAADLEEAEVLDTSRELEAAAAVEYFSSWRGRVEMTFALRDGPRVPDHWKAFDSRTSPLRKSLRAFRAADPINAILNYLYALAEAESRLACLEIGLDPGLGLLHADVQSRDSLALDLLEPVRPEVDAWVLDLLNGHVFRKADFTETRDGHCRILPPLTHQLATTMPSWAELVAPHAEAVTHALAEASDRPMAKATPLTSRKRRATAQYTAGPRRKETRSRQRRPGRLRQAHPLGPTCQGCGALLTHHQRSWCRDCWPSQRRKAGRSGSKVAQQVLVDNEARQARGAAIARGKRMAQVEKARRAGWEPDAWETQIWPQLRGVPLSQIMVATGLGITTASGIRTGKRSPHPRHWEALGRLVGESLGAKKG